MKGSFFLHFRGDKKPGAATEEIEGNIIGDEQSEQLEILAEIIVSVIMQNI